MSLTSLRKFPFTAIWHIVQNPISSRAGLWKTEWRAKFVGRRGMGSLRTDTFLRGSGNIRRRYCPAPEGQPRESASGCDFGSAQNRLVSMNARAVPLLPGGRPLGSYHRGRDQHTAFRESLDECTAHDLAGLRKTAAEFCFPRRSSSSLSILNRPRYKLGTTKRGEITLLVP
jgi:hypothetical protein